MQIPGNTYSVWETDGRIRAIIFEGVNGRSYYVTNRRDWKAKRIL
jgi:hypothetical protein